MEEAIHHFESLNNRLDSLQKEGLVKSYTRTGMFFVPLDVQQARIHAWKNFWTDQRLQCVRQLIEKQLPRQGFDRRHFNRFLSWLQPIISRMRFTMQGLFRKVICPL